MVARLGPRLSLMNSHGDQITRSASQVKKVVEGEKWQDLPNFTPNQVVINPSMADRTIFNTNPDIPNDEIVYDASDTEKVKQTVRSEQNDEDEIITKSWRIGGNSDAPAGAAEEVAPMVLRRSGRIRRAPNYYGGTR